MYVCFYYNRAGLAIRYNERNKQERENRNKIPESELQAECGKATSAPGVGISSQAVALPDPLCCAMGINRIVRSLDLQQNTRSHVPLAPASYRAVRTDPLGAVE